MNEITINHGSVMSVNEGIFVHGCNAQGVMGSGVAALVKTQWPSAYEAYIQAYQRPNKLSLGEVIAISSVEVSKHSQLEYSIFKSCPKLNGNLIVANAITQQYYGRNKNIRYVDYDAVFECFTKLRDIALATKLPLHFPLIGCGLANGKWEEVSSRILSAVGEEVSLNLWVQ